MVNYRIAASTMLPSNLNRVMSSKTFRELGKYIKSRENVADLDLNARRAVNKSAR